MGPCNGDSGGGLMDGNQVAPPLLLLFQVVGITSWEARGCGHPEHPGVFLQVAQNTKDQVLSGLRPLSPQVSYFLDWIATHTASLTEVNMI